MPDQWSADRDRARRVGQVPQSYGAVGPGAGQQVSLGAECHGEHGIGMPDQRRAQRPGMLPGLRKPLGEVVGGRPQLLGEGAVRVGLLLVPDQLFARPAEQRRSNDEGPVTT